MKFKARDIAVISIMCALLIGGQLLFTAVSGVEIVTVLLLCFCYTFGVRRGLLTATVFSLLRCLIWGFYPSVVVLYLVYYNLFALLFGLLGRFLSKERKGVRKAISVSCVEILFILLIATGSCYLAGVIKISRLLAGGLKVLSWIVVGIGGTGFIAFNVLHFSGKHSKVCDLIAVTVSAAICTICFTLLDDIITPLFLGFNADTALTYFYTSFAAMIPQTVCTLVTVSLLFLPLTKIFSYAAKNSLK